MQREPCPALVPFVALLWADDHPVDLSDAARFDDDQGDRQEKQGALVREHVLPTSFTHVVFRSAGGAGVRVLDRTDSPGAGTLLPGAVVGGSRSRFYARQASPATRSAGVLLRPGAARALLGVPAHAVAGQHVALADLWGGRAAETHDELMGIADPAQRLARLEGLLLEQLGAVGGFDPAERLAMVPQLPLHPAVLQALHGLAHGSRVSPWVQDMSHRHFIQLFRDAVGLTPKAYARVQRVRAALRAAVQPGAALAQVAMAAGYADQAHFHREVREIAGVSPAMLIQLAPGGGSHVPVPAGQICSRHKR